jgi:cytochrome c556
MMSRVGWVGVVMIVAGLMASGSMSIAGSTVPAEIIKIRKQGMKSTGAALKTVRDQLRRSETDMTAVTQGAAQMHKSAEQMAQWFPPGSGPEAGVKTGALPAIWSDAATFEKKRQDFLAAAGKFTEVAAGGDKKSIIAAVAPLNRTCKGCHDMFYEGDE